MLNLIRKTYKSARRPWVPLGFVLLFGVLGASLLVASHAETPLEPSVTWGTKNGNELVNLNSGLCLATPGTTESASGTKLVLEACSGINDQKWALTWGGGTVTNTTVTNGYTQCLDDTLARATAGNPVQVWTCNGEAGSQTWSTGYGEGSIRIHGLCLGVNNNAKTVGSAVVIMDCNVPAPPNPTVGITAPGGGATITGSSTTVSARASVSSGTITNITLTANGTTLNKCANTTSCSATWNTGSLQNGSYTVVASVSASGGGSAQASESVTINKPAPPSSPPAGSGSGSGSCSSSGSNGGSHSSGSPPQGSTTGSSSTGSDNSDSSTTGTTGSNTVGDPASPTPNDSPGAVVYGTSSGSSSSHSKTTKKTAHKSNLGAIFGLIALFVAVVVLVLFLRKRRQAAEAALAAAMYASPAPVPVPTPVETPDPALTQVYAATGSSSALPREDDAATAARLNWWMPDGVNPQNAPASPHAAEQPPDMFEEGRKRLEDEEKEGRIRQQ